MKITKCVLLGFVVAANMCAANSVYLAQSSAGGNTGADCADAKAVSYFNSSGNWSATPTGIQIGPATVVHLCGIITTELSFQGSGSSGNVVELRFETGASIQISPGMDASGIINTHAFSWILVDGGVSQPCGWNTSTNFTEGTCNGTIENMLYGSSGASCPGGACTTQFAGSNTAMINGTGSNVEIRNLNMGPAYVHISTGGGATDGNGTGCILVENGSNWNVHDSKLHDGLWCVTDGWLSGTQSNMVFSSNEIYNNSHDFAIDGTATINGLTISGNYSHNHSNWDTTGDDNHANFVHFFTSVGTGTASNIGIYNNIIGGNTRGRCNGLRSFQRGVHIVWPVRDV